MAKICQSHPDSRESLLALLRPAQQGPLSPFRYTVPADLPHPGWIHSLPRLMHWLEGEQDLRFCDGQGMDSFAARPGATLFFTGGAWWRPSYEKDYKVFSIVFYPSFVRILTNRHRTSEGHQPSQVWYHTSRPLDSRAHRLLTLAQDFCLAAAPVALVQPLARSLLLCCLQLADTDEGSSSISRAATTYRAICAFVEENFAQPIDRNATAQALGLSPAHISRLFRQQGDQTFSRYLTSCRMARARTLLLRSSLRVKEIALQSGYTNVEYFYNEFRRLHARSPSAFRRERQAEHDQTRRR